MFPNLEFIKTCLNGLRSRIEKVEKSISKALASIKAQLKENAEAIKSSTADWNQNDPDALDYVKNRTHWDDESQTQTIDYNAWKGERPSIPLILGVWYEVSWSSAATGNVYAQYMNTDDVDGRFECKQNSAGELYVGFDSGSPFCIFSDRTEINTTWFQSNRVNGLKLTGEITPGLHQLDKKYIPRDVLNEIYTLGESVENQNSALSRKMNAANPTGTGAFSLNRKSDSEVGGNSFAAGFKPIASGECSFAVGREATASGDFAFAAGYKAIASGIYSFAAGNFTTASGDYSFVTGRRNVEDIFNRYPHIVGNGNSARNSNAYTLDWDGNGWFAGDVFVGGTGQDEGVKLLKAGEAIPIPRTASVGQVLAVKAVDENGNPTEWEVVDPMVVSSSTSGSTKKFRITVDDSGTISATEVVS